MGLASLQAGITAAEGVANIVKGIFGKDDKALTQQEILERLRQQPHLAQAEITKIEAQSKDAFTSRWRPSIGYVCAAGLAYAYLVAPVMDRAIVLTAHLVESPDAGAALVAALPQADTKELTALTLSLIGLGGFRTVEKLLGRAK